MLENVYCRDFLLQKKDLGCRKKTLYCRNKKHLVPLAQDAVSTDVERVQGWCLFQPWFVSMRVRAEAFVCVRACACADAHVCARMCTDIRQTSTHLHACRERCIHAKRLACIHRKREREKDKEKETERKTRTGAQVHRRADTGAHT